MVSDQMSAPSDQTPIPPLARPAKTKSTTKKMSKLRKLTDAQIAEEANLMADAAQAGSFPNKKISVAAWGTKRNLSLYMVQRVFIDSSLQKLDYELDHGVANATGKLPYIDNRGMYTIPDRLIDAHNKTVSADKQFLKGQQFVVTFGDDTITSTRVR